MSYHPLPDSHTLRATPLTATSCPAGAASHTASPRVTLQDIPQSHIRNVSLVAHVDHGKTTLTDALLRRAGLLPAEGATTTFTDRLPVEKERGITVKAQTCTVCLTRSYNKKMSNNTSHKESISGDSACSSSCSSTAGSTDEVYLINLIDTPGHVDFQYEVSRSLRASEGAALLVDVKQGVEAQTLAQLYAAMEHELTIVPVLTKLDAILNEDEVERTVSQLEDSTGLLRREVVLTSAMAKEGLEAFFDAVIARVPPPCGRVGFSDWSQLPVMHPESAERRAAEAALVPLRALLFDCWTVRSGGMAAAASQLAGNARGQQQTSTRAAASFTATAASAAGTATAGGSDEDAVYCLVRLIDGRVQSGTRVVFFQTGKSFLVQEVGLLHPSLFPTAALTAGMVGYVLLRGVVRADLHIGDTLCTLPTPRHKLCKATAQANSTTATTPGASSEDVIASKAAAETTAEDKAATYNVLPVPGFKQVRPVVFAGFYPNEGEYIDSLRTAVDKLTINDPSVTVEALSCAALGAGLQLGFLGLLHLQVFQARLRDEFGQAVLVTPPQVQYMYIDKADLTEYMAAAAAAAAASDDVSEGMSKEEMHRHAARQEALRRPLSVHTWRWPHEGVALYLEPIVHPTVVTPTESFGRINTAALTTFRATQREMRPIDHDHILVRYDMPLAELARGFVTVVKSSSHGYATLSYDEASYAPADLVKVDIIVNKARVSALSMICLRREASAQARHVLRSLKESLRRTTVDLPLQALVGSTIVARETIKAYKKDVTAKIHAGDISRKQKKWNDQRKGKERMARRSFGAVTLDQDILAAAMGATLVN